jgi:hypothetical protein
LKVRIRIRNWRPDAEDRIRASREAANKTIVFGFVLPYSPTVLVVGCLVGIALAIAVVAALVAGFTKRPSAPALKDEPVYRNAREGFHFLVPEGWMQQARGDLPSGKLDKERLLVQYIRGPAEGLATLEVAAVDLPPDVEVVKYQGEPSHDVLIWNNLGPNKKLEIGGAPAERLIYAGNLGKEPFIKEVVVFRRGERVYFFTALFPAADTLARDMARRAVDGVIWE